MNIIHYLVILANGLATTLMLMVSALILGSGLACVMTLGLLSKRIYLKIPVEIFIFFVRGTPLLVQIFLIYYGLGQFDWIRESFAWVILREPFACAVIALALNTCAYTTVLFRGAIFSVPRTEISACEALGMSYGLMLRRIVFPRALRIVLPAYSNEVIIILKSTTLASTITILDLMGVTNHIIAQTYSAIPFLCLAAVVYLLLNMVIMHIFRYFEKRANRYLHV